MEQKKVKKVQRAFWVQGHEYLSPFSVGEGGRAKGSKRKGTGQQKHMAWHARDMHASVPSARPSCFLPFLSPFVDPLCLLAGIHAGIHAAGAEGESYECVAFCVTIGLNSVLFLSFCLVS